MIVTLAGHVDHGKTSLVRALTGVNTDRLAQEQQRGLTIDLGFAYIDQGNIGFVDVPGHHKFIHNMVAGVANQQTALLVIAADDGPMPQSKEHLDILTLVGLQNGVIALTKTDRVDSARLEACRDEIRQMIAGSFLQDAPIFTTSIEAPESTTPLLNHLREMARAQAQQSDAQPFRLAVDRTFTVKGAGLVVTGTIHSGSVDMDVTLHHYPSGKPVRVRGIRAQDQAVAVARAGERCALNLTGLDIEEIERGDWITAESEPGYAEITAELKVLNDFPRPLKHWTPVHIYHATSHSTGRIALLDETRVAPGQSTLVDVICDTPLTVHHGDQIVLRDQSLDVTLGGAKVVYASTQPTHRRRSDSRRHMLNCYNSDDARTCLEQLVKSNPVNAPEFRKLWHLTEADWRALLKNLDALKVGDTVIARSYLQAMQTSIADVITQFQADNPSAPGLKENGFHQIPKQLRQRLLNAMVQAGELVNESGFYRLPSHQAQLPDALAEAWTRLEPALDVAQPPSSGDLAKQWQQSQKDIESALKELSKRGLVVHVAVHRFYLPTQLEHLAQTAIKLANGQAFSVRQFRDTTNIGRNVAIEVLEYFDRRGFTRRQDNERVLLRETL